MTDYRTMFDRDYIGAWDLPHDATVTISKVEAKKIRNKTAANFKPILHFRGKEKALVCNKTNGKTIAAMYGNDVEKWLGKRITIYATTTTFGSETVGCIRVRPGIPQGKDSPPDPTPPTQADAGASDAEIS